MVQHSAVADATELVSQAEIARRIKKNRSSVKRYLDQYPELKGKGGKVDWAAFQRHRGENIHLDEDDRAATPPTKSANDAKARRAVADADLREIELAEKRGELVNRAAYDAEIRTMLSDLLREIEAVIEPTLRSAGSSDARGHAAAVISAIHEKRNKYAGDIAQE